MRWRLFFSLLVVGCHSHAPKGDVSGILALERDSTAGEAIFTETCALSRCHGSTGLNGSAPGLDTAVPHADDPYLASVIRYGAGDMPAQTQLNDQEIAHVMGYVRQRFP